MRLPPILFAVAALTQPDQSPKAPLTVLRRRFADAIVRRRKAGGVPAVVAFLIGVPIRRLVTVEHFVVLGRHTAGVDVSTRPGLRLVELAPNTSTLTSAGLVEGRPPGRREGVPRGRSDWLGLRDETGRLVGRVCLELEQEHGAHRGWNTRLRRGEAVVSGLWTDPSVRIRGAALMLVQGVLVAARERGFERVIGVVHKYNTRSMLLMRVLATFRPEADAWTLRLARHYRFSLRNTRRDG